MKTPRILVMLALSLAPLACSTGGDDGGGGTGVPTDPGPPDPDPGTGTIVGSITGNGTGFRNVELRLYPPGSSQPARSTFTDDAGDYTFAGLDIGDWEIEVVLPPATDLPDDRIPVTIADGGVATIDVALQLLPVSLAAHVQPILTLRCTECHAGGGAPEGMRLTDGDTHAATVGVPAAQLSSLSRVEPGEPDDSYLIHKIQGTHVPAGGSGHQMPPSRLRDQTIDLIRRWTAEGALDN